MCGVPGSGKTTYVKKHTTPNSVHVSRDLVRFSMLGACDEYFAKEKEVFNKWIEDIQKYLDEGFDVYADATHLNKGSRNKTLSNLNLKNHEIHAICLCTDKDICISRNSLRTGREQVPTDVIINMFNSYSIPYIGEAGWNYKTITLVEGGNEY